MLPDQDTIEVWIADQSKFDLQQLQSDCSHWLHSDDLRRLQRLRNEQRRLQLLMGQVLVRAVLSQYYPAVRPADWYFVTNAYGKPALDPNHHALPLYFNLSHSQGRLAVAVAGSDSLGVDIEACSRPRCVARIASRYFAPQEAQVLLELPAPQQLARFYELWTLKEAYIKARGLGLAIPLQQFSFQFREDGQIAVEFDRQLGDDARLWSFWQMEAGPTHKLALAIKRKNFSSALRVQTQPFTRLLLNATSQ